MTAPPPDAGATVAAGAAGAAAAAVTSPTIPCTAAAGTGTNAEIFAIADGPEALDFQAWGKQFQAFLKKNSRTGTLTTVKSNSSDGFAGGANQVAAMKTIIDRLQARTGDAATPLDTIAVFCHGEAFAVGVGISLGNVNDLATEIRKHVDVTKPFRMAYFACMAGGSTPTRGSPQLGTYGDQRGNGGLAEATCGALIAAGLTKVQVDGHYTYGIGSCNPNMRRFYSEGMYPNFIRTSVSKITGTALAATDAVPAASADRRARRAGDATLVEDPRASLCDYNRPTSPLPADLKESSPHHVFKQDIPAIPNVYRTTMDADAPGKGFTSAMWNLYGKGDYWLDAMYYSIQKIWADSYAKVPKISPPDGLLPSPMPSPDLSPDAW